MPRLIADKLVRCVEKYTVKKVEYYLSECRIVRLFLNGDVVGEVTAKFGNYRYSPCIRIPKLVFRKDLNEDFIRSALNNINEILKRSRNKKRQLTRIFGRKYAYVVMEELARFPDDEIRAVYEMLQRNDVIDVAVRYDKVRGKVTGRVMYKPVLEITVEAVHVRGTIHIKHDTIGQIDDELLTLLSMLDEKTSEEGKADIVEVIREVTTSVQKD